MAHTRNLKSETLYNYFVLNKKSKATPLTFENFNRALKNFKEETVSEIQGEMQKGFTEVKQRLSRVEEELQNKADKTDLQRVELNLQRVESKLDRIEKQVTHVTLEELTPRVNDHEKRIQKLEAVVSSS